MRIADQFFFIPAEEYLLNRNHLDISILIKTFNRPDNLKRLLVSLRRLKCKLPVYIADDSQTPYEAEIKALFPDLDLHYYTLPYDTGLSEGRNVLLREVKTDYFLLCDDDFIFDKRSRVPWLKSQLLVHQLDILGGVFFEYRPVTKWERRIWHYVYRLIKKGFIIPARTIYNYYGSFHINGDTCRLSRPAYQAPLTRCDFCHNFFLGRTAAVLQMGGWSKALKVGEHENFFIKAKLNGIQVATTQEAGIIHGNFYDSGDAYQLFRNRSQQFQSNSLAEFGILKVEEYEKTTGFGFGE